MSDKSPFSKRNDVVWFYNQRGRPLFYLQDNEHFYHVDGTPIGYVHDNKYVVGYNGESLGWLHDGWIMDFTDGSYAFFSEYAVGGPERPVRGVRPVKGVRRVRPVKAIRSVRPVRPVRTLSWTRKDIAAFFPDYT